MNDDKMIIETGYCQVQDEIDSPRLAESGYSQVKVVNTPNGPECLYIDDGEKASLISDGKFVFINIGLEMCFLFFSMLQIIAPRYIGTQSHRQDFLCVPFSFFVYSLVKMQF